MKTITVKQIVEATGGRLLSGSEASTVSHIKQDSRVCGEGDLFVAIKGENMDGHNFVREVIEAGCETVLLSDPAALEGAGPVNAILVEDTVRAMGDLAAWYLDWLQVKRVAVTGSVGKTSVRDMIYYVLSEKYTAGRNMKNFNNDIGLPLSIFQFDENTEAVVLEMGMNHFGEIDRLAEIVRPEIAVITNIGVAHVENLGSRDGIFQAKMEIAGHIAQGGTLVYAEDDEFLTRERTAGAYRQISVGTNGKSDYILSDVRDFGLEGTSFSLEHEEQIYKITLPLPGVHNATNAALAIAVGYEMGMTVEECSRGLAKAQLTGRRLRTQEGKSVRVIDDTYNASTDSMKSALKVLEHSQCSGKRVAILGDMFELGEESQRQHRGVGLFAKTLEIDRVIAIGKDAAYIREGAEGGRAKTCWYATKDEFYTHMAEIITAGDVVLVKGSRGMKMEDIVEKVLEL